MMTKRYAPVEESNFSLDESDDTACNNRVTCVLLGSTSSFSDDGFAYDKPAETFLHPSVMIPNTTVLGDDIEHTMTATPPQSPMKRRPPGRLMTSTASQKHQSTNTLPPTLEEYFGSVQKYNGVVDTGFHTPSTMVSTIASSVTGTSCSSKSNTFPPPPPIATRMARGSNGSITTAQQDDSVSDFGFTESVTAWKRDSTEEAGRRIKVAIRLKTLSESTPRGWNVHKSGPDGDDSVCFLQQNRCTRRQVVPSSPMNKNHPTYAFDHLYEENSTTEQVYESLGKPIIEAVGTGDSQHGTIFAYGATGSGKTYTMQGSGDHPGVIHLAANNLFSILEEEMFLDNVSSFQVKAQYIEIYNEQVRDLLDNLRPLVVQEDPSGNVMFDAVEEEVRCADDVSRILDSGNINRACGSTQQNSHSSRSHALFRLSIQMTACNGQIQNVDGSPSVITLVDLAGSENSARAVSTGTRKQEGGMINQSLLTLSQVIQSLSLPEHKRPKHISYRSSKLTRLLKPQLTGKSSIALLSCVSAELSKLDETKSTLVFATTAKKIVVKPSFVRFNMNDSAHSLAESNLVDELQRELYEARQALKLLQDRYDENLRLAIIQASTKNASPVAVEAGDEDEELDEGESNDASSEAAVGDGVEESNTNKSKVMATSNCSSSFESDFDTPPVSVVMIDSQSPLVNPLEDEKVKQLLENADVRTRFLEQQLVAAEVLVDGLYQTIRDLQLKQQEELAEKQKQVETTTRDLQLKHCIELELLQKQAKHAIRDLKEKHMDEMEQLQTRLEIKFDDVPTHEDIEFVLQQGYALVFFCLFSSFILLNGMIETFTGVVIFLWVGREISVSCL